MALRPLSNLPLKVISLLVAGVLWLAVSGQSTVERNIRVPLEYQNVPPGMEMVGDPPGQADVRLRGSSGNLARVVQGDVVAALDLTNARPGTRIFNLRASEVRVPFGVEVVQVTPPTVSLEFEYAGQKVVPVSPVIEGDPEPGFVVGRITTSPATVQVLGPIGRLQALSEATTEPVRVDGARTNLTDKVTVGVEDTAVRLREPLVAVVTVEIVPAPVQRTLQGLQVRAENAGRGLLVRLSPVTVSVVVRGTQERMAGVGAGDLQATVDLTELPRGQHSVPVRVPNREGVAVERIEPANITVSIR
ncbi:YbbR-like protein [Luteitalea pratensis]|uniref:YbbR-like protein n=1 Tax=Luteitalea pratensis TaxID=1855912 RepID=A0A143PGP1_LUTPR|nr:CdaR family protein [Luteitalea pratensis]AMY07440.1 YbbR-like protein [Luteitalea pratensis]